MPTGTIGSRTGTVTAFDDDRGLGEITADGGDVHHFHCTGIADGSRTIEVGTVVRYGTARWTVEYSDVDPGDVALVRDSSAEAEWDGGSTASDLWQDGANWAGDTAPSPGDTLIFPAGAARTGNTNDFPAGTSFMRVISSCSGMLTAPSRWEFSYSSVRRTSRMVSSAGLSASTSPQPTRG